MTKQATVNVVDVPDLIGRTRLEPRPYQGRIIQRALNNYLGEKQLRSQLIESATGSGKTSMGLMICKGMQNQIDDLEVAWFSMRRNLLSQAERENIKMAIGAKVHFLSMFEKELPDTIRRAKKRANKVMVVVDEAQHDAAGSMVHQHEIIHPDYILGMTATPFRTDHVKLCFDAIIKDAGLGTLIREGYLSQYRHFTIPKWGVEEVAQMYLREPERWGKTISYWHRVDQCTHFKQLLEAEGHHVEVITGSTDREQQIEDFKADKFKVIANCMVLTEGFDCPDLETVFCRPSCKGVTIQMAGRAFRKHPKVPLKNIVQCKKGWPFIKLAPPAEQYKMEKIEDVERWLALKANPHIDALGCKMLVAMSSINVKMPDFILKARLKAAGRSRNNPWH